MLAVLSTSTACRSLRTENARAAEPTASPAQPRASATADTGGITAETFAEAEKLAGVEYTPAERQLMLEAVEDQIASTMARRGLPQPNALAPATEFDPRLPGTELPAPPNVLKLPKIEAPPPSSDEDLAFAPALVQAFWIRQGHVTSERLTELYLDRLRTLGTALECVVTTTEERALEQARRADAERARGKIRSPLHGVPWGAKDLFDTAGVGTTWGATPYAERVPDEDAVVVRRLEEAGTVLAAKLTTGALAYGDTWFGGHTRNPWNPAEGSSGSSAGPAAAVAAGLVGFALGTETLGSIVSPAMRCGVTGLRPTFGRVARTGCMTLSWTMDKIGPMTRTVDDAAVVLSLVNGADDGDPSSASVPYHYRATRSIKGLRVGFDPRHFEGEQAADIDRKALETLRGLGVQMVEVTVPELPYPSLMAILLVESATAFEELTLSDRDDLLMWQGKEAWPNTFRLARFISGIDFLAAQRFRRQVMRAFEELMADIDLLAAPSYADSLLLATNCTGHPCLTVRAGFISEEPRPFLDGFETKSSAPAQVPHGFTLWGRLYEEGTMCRLGRALENALGVWDRRPPRPA